MMKIIIAGLGLIGGSFARSIKKFTDHHVIGIDSDDSSLDMALAMESIDEVIPVDRMDLLKKGDLIIVALPPHEIVKFILDNVKNFRSGSIVTDVCGVKEHILNSVAMPLEEVNVDFIGSHPMAGTEFSGFAFSNSNMFHGASYLLTPSENAKLESIEMLRELALNIGFQNVIVTDPQTHDKAIAYTSQLAHIVSNSYIRSTTLPKEKGFSANSFLDMTRVALLDPNTWSELFILNKENLISEIDQLTEHIGELRNAIASENRTEIKNLLRKGRDLKVRNTMQRKTLV
ncbi:MAG: prephenate dehydrogenase [Anaerovoracaceae bacterium]